MKTLLHSTSLMLVTGVLLLNFFFSTKASAQIVDNGAYTIDTILANTFVPNAATGNFKSFRRAITALNATATPGLIVNGVTFTVTAGQSFGGGAPIGIGSKDDNLRITYANTGGGTITFQKSAGVNPIILSSNDGTLTPVYGVGTLTGNADAFIRFVGTKNIVFDGIDLSEPNTVATAAMDYGYYLVRASTTVSCVNITIKNCNITLNKTSATTTGTVGIVQTNLNDVGTATTPAAAANTHNGNKFYGNVISNVVIGIALIGTASATLYDQNTEVGTSLVGNTITNFGTSVAISTVSSYGIEAVNQAGLTIANNNINTGSSSGTTTGSVLLCGIFTTTTNLTVPIYNNAIYNLSMLGLTTGQATGNLMGIVCRPTIATFVGNIYNNYIGDLKVAVASGNTTLAGMNFTGLAGSKFNVYHNTVYLSATSNSATFGSAGVLRAPAPTYDFRNNIIVNLSTSSVTVTTGVTAAMRVNAADNFSTWAASNNNIYYAGTPSASKLIYYNTIAPASLIQTMCAFTTLTGTAETNSGSYLPTFLSTTSGTATYLHLDPSVAQLAEGGGTPVTTPINITVDWDGNTRSVTLPDIGADEYSGLPEASMTIASSNTVQVTTIYSAPSVSQPIIRIDVTPSGTYNPVTINSFLLNSTGTTTLSDITAANTKIWYTGSSSTFNAATATLFGTGTASFSNFTISGTQKLGGACAGSANYFWLTYDITAGAICNNMDAQCISITYNGGSTSTPATTNPAGSSQIVSPLSFNTSTPQILTAASGAQSIISADFSGDGRPDLAIANANASGTAYVYLNNGSGVFPATANPQIVLGGNPYGITAGDFTGDGRPDLVVIVENLNQVFVYPNTSTGTSGPITFGTKVTLLGLSSPRQACTGFFNADAFLDLAVANNSNTNVVVFLGNGSGGFGAGSSFPVGFVQIFLTSADFNGDGKADLATGNFSNASVSVLLGNGDGTFQTAVTFASGVQPFWLTTGDFNTDGKIDLASANVGSSSVSVFINNGTSTLFLGAVNYTASATGNSPYGVASADFNGDGKPDLAATDYGSGKADILLGKGDGTFVTPFSAFTSGTANSALSLTGADFNGDGKIDLAVGNQGTQNIYVLLNNNTNVPFPTVTASATTPVCTTGTLTLTGSGTGGVGALSYLWSGANSYSNAAQNPPGIVNPTTAAAGTYSLFVTDTRGCIGSAGTIAVVTAPPTASISYAGTPFCKTTGAGQAVTLIGTNGYTGGTYSSTAGLTIDGVTGAINPSTSTAGTYTVTYNTPVAGGCAAVPATTLVNITAPPTASISYAGDPFCQTLGAGQPVTLNGTNGYTGGTYSSTAGLTIDGSTGAINPSASTAAAYTVTYNTPVAGGCAAVSATTPVTIVAPQPPPTASISYAGDPFCKTVGVGQAVTLTGTNGYTGGTYSSTAGLTLDGVTGAINPSTSTPGTYTVTYNTPAACGNPSVPATTFVTITALPTASISYAGTPFCKTAGAGQPVTLTGTNGYTGGTYSSTPGLSLDGSTGDIDPSTSTAGAYTVTYNTPAAGGCAAVPATNGVTINLFPTATANATTPVCTNGTLSLTGTGSASTAPYSYLWSGPNAYSNGTQNPVISNPALTAAGVYSLTVTDANGCKGTGNTSSVVVKTSPSTSQSFTRCAGQSVTVGSHTYTSSGTYIDKLSAANGCDSIVTTKLSVYYGTSAITASFSAVTTFPVTQNPQYGTIADFNNDGKLDLAMSNQSAASISILLGTGTGSFGAKTDFAVGTTPVSVANGDFNADGNLDVAVANFSSGNVSVLLGNGSGGFGAATNYTTGSQAYSVVTDDFNADGNLDLAVCNFASNTVSILLGNGLGSFAAATNFGTVGTGPFAITKADFNKDGKMDLATANSNTSNISVLIGNGNGTFAAAVTYSTGGNCRAVNCGDFDGDGDIDLVAGNQTGNNVSVLLNSGLGSFATANNFTTGGNGAISVAVVDLNGDGNLDLAVSNSGSNTVGVLAGNGAGSFGAAITFPTAGSGNYLVASADFNGDGKPDLVSANNTSSNVSILLNTISLATAIANSPVCSGGGINNALNLTGGQAGLTSYTWSGPNSFNSLSQNFSIVSPSALAAGIYTLTVTESHGCTATASTVSVVINSPKVTNQTISACGGYQVGNNIYTATGNYVDVLVSADGCDSTVNTNLTILQNATFTQNITLCAEHSISVGTYTHTASGKYVDRLFGAAANGCDSVVTTNLNAVFGGGGPAEFLASSVYGVGMNPQYGTIADINGDGKPDVVTANQTSNNVSVLLGNGDGTFGSAINTGAGGTTPVSVASGDFNGDTKLDVAVANYTTGNVSVLLGNGDGTFGSPTTYTTGSNAYSVVAKDFNSDGKLDLAVCNYTANTVSILIGVGNGTFGAATNLSGGGSPFSIITADFNGDGKADLATGNSTSNTVAIYIGNGLGGFTGPTTFATLGTLARHLTSADFNGDGKLDIAVTNQTSNTVAVLLGNGVGSFGGATLFATGLQPISVASADFNGDGKADMVVSNGNSSSVSVFIGNGTGGFGAVTSYSVGTSPYMVAVSDFNGDGKVDLAVNNNGSSNVYILPGNGAGGFGTLTLASGGSTPKSVVQADFNNDGKMDLAITNSNSNNVAIFLGNGNGTFAAASTFTASGGGTVPFFINSADFNNDGNADLALVHQSGSSTVKVFMGNGNGTFGSPSVYGVGVQPLAIASADYNGDGKIDLAVSNSIDNNISVLLNNGNGTFGTATNFSVGVGNPRPWWLITDDFDGDGKADLATGNQVGNSISVLLGNGNGTFGSAATYAAGTSTFGICSGDFTGDGKPDIAAANSGTNTISVFINNGNGTFGAATNFVAGTSAQSVTAADFNGDGKLDLSVAVSGNMAILLGNGAGSFGSATNFTAGNVPLSLVHGDFDGNGKIDVAIGNQSGGTISVFINITATLANPATATSNSPVCPFNETLNLSGGPNGLANYSWSGPNGYSGSGQNPSLVNPTLLGVGDYKVTVTDSRGCTGTASTTVVLKPIPAISVTPPTAVCTGSTSVSLAASGADTYTWSPNLFLSSTTGSSVTAQISQLTFYTVTGFSSLNGCASDIVIIPVATVSAGGKSAPIYSIVCSGNSKLLSVTNAAGNSYQWQSSLDGVSNWSYIAGATSINYNATPTSKTYYRLMAKSDACWDVASTIAVVDISAPSITISPVSKTDISITLDWSPIGGGNYNITYTGTGIPTSTISAATPPKTLTGLTANGTYNVTITQTGVPGVCSASGTLSGIQTLCAMPSGVSVSPVGNNSLKVDWTGPAGSYRVYYRNLFSQTSYVFRNAITVTTSGSLTIGGLASGGNYEIYVVLNNCPAPGNFGQPGELVYGRTNSAVTPTCTPTWGIDYVRSLCPIQIEVAMHGSPTGKYSVYLQRLTPTVGSVVGYTVTGDYFQTNVGSPGQTYLVAVAAKCATGSSEMIVYPGGITTKALCNSVTNLVLSHPTCNGFTASWNSDPCSDNTDNYYGLYIRKQGSLSWNSYPVTPPASPISPYKKVNWLGKGVVEQAYVRTIYKCTGYTTLGSPSQIETITTLSSGCREEDDNAELIEPEEPSVQIISSDNSEMLSLYPNPNSGQFRIDISRLSNTEEQVRVEVMNVVGQTILTYMSAIRDGHSSDMINLPASTSSGGTYFVRVTVGGSVYTTKVNISR